MYGVVSVLILLACGVLYLMGGLIGSMVFRGNVAATAPCLGHGVLSTGEFLLAAVFALVAHGSTRMYLIAILSLRTGGLGNHGGDVVISG